MGATNATGEPAPKIAGSLETFTVTGLTETTPYHFAMKTSDDESNSSTLSNVIACTTGVQATKIEGVTAHAWPNGRTVDHYPSYSVDGSLTTYTWTTNPYTNDPVNYLGLAFADTVKVSRIRWWRDPNCGSSSSPDWVCAKDLTIQFTQDEGSMSGRSWQNVTNMQNGYLGAELVDAASVNADGTIDLEFHDSSVSGWASVSFDPQAATGIRIAFARTDHPQYYENNHYKVHEIEAYEYKSFGINGRTVSSPALLHDNRPNPFRSSTSTVFSLKAPQRVSTRSTTLLGGWYASW